MKKQMLINAVHLEQKRMAIVEDGKLVEFNIQMAVKKGRFSPSQGRQLQQLHGPCRS